jgi:hypothetical protein
VWVVDVDFAFGFALVLVLRIEDGRESIVEGMILLELQDVFSISAFHTHPSFVDDGSEIHKMLVLSTIHPEQNHK